jgi:hypothetical protein
LFPTLKVLPQYSSWRSAPAHENTAKGLASGVRPFFGDQFFWGRVMTDAGAGPEPIPIHRLNSDALAEAFEFCRRAEVRERAAALGTAVRETDGVELVVRSVYRHLPAPAMCCANDPGHRATVYCDACGQRLCPDCARTLHSGHVLQPYGYVDWSVRPGHRLTREMGELIADAASALKAGLEEIMPNMGPWRHRVVLNDGESSSATKESSVGKVERSPESQKLHPSTWSKRTL